MMEVFGSPITHIERNHNGILQTRTTLKLFYWKVIQKNKRRTMKSNDAHLYELSNVTKGIQKLQFIHKTPTASDPKELATVVDGVTNEEVIMMLLDRLEYLNGKFPCRQNSIAITKLEESLMWLNNRTAERMARKVEGKNIA